MESISPRSPISPSIAARNEAILRGAPPIAIEDIKTLIREFGGNVNEVAITAAVMMKAAKRKYDDAADLCRMVADMPTETIRNFSTGLTDEQVDQIQRRLVRMGGGSKKKRRTGKKSKRKTRKARTIKKNGKKRN
jgi:hypothetical protein